jgi:omega-6 fatty acid desaturase (delta-12 desaturase)
MTLLVHASSMSAPTPAASTSSEEGAAGSLRGLRAFERPSTARAAWQLVNTLVPYLASLALMVLMLRRGWPWWSTLLVAVPASGFMVRLFVLMHDCIHHSFLPSRRAERLLGGALGVLVFTPCGNWGHEHLLHHATSGDLDRRGRGDHWTMTVAEYLAAPRAQRWQYRLTRQPALMLLFGPLFVFLIANRIPPRGGSPARVRSVLLTNLGLAAIVLAASATIGLRAYLLVQLPVLFLAGVWGIWLFYVQHQFEPSYWSRSDAWEAVPAALRGSSYFRLPKVLQWFSANIGLHHVHHLRPRIPNYRLQRCHDATPALRAVPPLTLRGSLRCGGLALWDEHREVFVSFRDLRPAPRP